MTLKSLLCLLACSLLLAACSTLKHPTHNYLSGLGSDDKPVRCDGKAGADEYLDRLIHRSGERVIYYEVGPFGKGPDGHPLVGYACRVGEREKATLVFMDLHHPGYREKRALKKFKLAPLGARREAGVVSTP